MWAWLRTIFTLGFMRQSMPTMAIAFTTPTDGAIIPGPVLLATTTKGPVKFVDFAVDGFWIASVQKAPYQAPWNPELYADGDHVLSATAGYSAGITVVAKVHVHLQRGTPSSPPPPPDTTAPVIVITAPAAGAMFTSGLTLVAASATDAVGVTQVQFLVDGVALGAPLTTAPYQVTWNAPAGFHTITATARDAAGNIGVAVPVAVTVQPAADVTAPAVIVTAPSNASTPTEGPVTLRASATDAVGVTQVQFFVDGIAVGDPVMVAPFQTTWTAPVGAHTITATARDAAGNIGTSAAIAVTVQAASTPDVIAPTITIMAPVNGTTMPPGTVTLRATSSDNVATASVQFAVDGAPVGPALTLAPYVTPWTAVVGPHTITALATDAAGNQAVAAVAVTIAAQVDTIPPVVALTAPAVGATLTAGTIPLAATATDASGIRSVQFAVDGVAVGQPVTVAPYTATWLAVAGAHTITATAIDNAGNAATASRSVTVQAAVVPISVTLTSPSGRLTGTVLVAATASASAVGVQFAIDGINIGAEDTVAPFQQNWDTTTVSDGTHALTATARDALGNIAVASRSLSIANHTSASIISQNDITYLGAIRMPNIDTSAAYGGLAGRQVGGVTHLFVCGNFTSDPETAFPIYELADPGGGYSTNYHTAPQATLVTDWGVPYGNKRHTWDIAGNPIAPAGNVFFAGGLYWNEATQLLYWSYFDSYPSNHPPEWGLGATRLDNPVGPVTTAFGPWRTQSADRDGTLWYGPQNGACFMAHPVTGKLLCGGTSRSINVQVPWGPQVWGSIDWPTAATPGGFGNPNLLLADRYLCYYFMGGPNSGYNQTTHYFLSDGTPNDGVIRSFRLTNTGLTNIFEGDFEGPPILSADPTKTGVATWTDEQDGIGGMIWLELTHKRGVIFLGTLVGGYSLDPTDAVNTAHNWYRNAGVGHEFCRHGQAAPLAVTGPVSTKKVPVLLVYDPDKLTRVQAGTAVDYEQEADSIIDLEATYGIKTATMNQLTAKSIAGTYWDPSRNYLFVLASHADDTIAGDVFLQSLIHVFHINDVP